MVKIIAIEGLDYSGKTETSRRMGMACRDHEGVVVNAGIVYRTPIAQQLGAVAIEASEAERERVYTVMMMLDAIEAKTRPDDTRIVIQDRYWPSVISYGRFLNGASSIHNFFDYSPLFTRPDATIVLECSVEELRRRSGSRQKKSIIDRLLLEDEANIFRLKEEIDRSVVRLPQLLRIDTTGMPIEVVSQTALDFLRQRGIF